MPSTTDQAQRLFLLKVALKCPNKLADMDGLRHRIHKYSTQVNSHFSKQKMSKPRTMYHHAINFYSLQFVTPQRGSGSVGPCLSVFRKVTATLPQSTTRRSQPPALPITTVPPPRVFPATPSFTSAAHWLVLFALVLHSLGAGWRTL